jgi:putative ABC transport system permease protein
VGLIKAGLKELDARLLMMPLPLAQRLLNTTAVSRYTVLLAPGSDAHAFSRRLEHAAAERGLALRAMRWVDHSSGEVYRRGMELLGLFRAFVVVIVVAIAAMSVWMTMMRAVSERTREVGMLRSLGFLRRHVVALFLFEAGYLALASCVVGAVAAAVLIGLCNRSGVTYKAGILTDSIPLAIAVVPSVWLGAVVCLSGLALLATLVPARHAARMPIPDALGHV